MVKSLFPAIEISKQPLHDILLEHIRAKPDRIALVSHKKLLLVREHSLAAKCQTEIVYTIQFIDATIPRRITGDPKWTEVSLI